LDPGVRTFLTGYSPNGKAFKVADEAFHETNSGSKAKNSINKLQKRLFHLQKLKKDPTRTPSQKKSTIRSWNKLQLRVHNKIDDLHWKTARCLLNDFTTIIIPPLGVSNMVRKKTICLKCSVNNHGTTVPDCKSCGKNRAINETTVKQMLTLRHGQFRSRLIEKSREFSGRSVFILSEAYTTKTCGKCGILNNNIGSNKVFNCANESCNLIIDRDINGARNILLRNAKLK